MQSEPRIRHTDELVSKIISLWQLWFVIAAGIIAGINFYNTVKRLDDDQKAWKITIDQRRDRTRDDIEAIRLRIISAERDIEWLKREKN